jgi:LCP family protein required for cell wall assembly
VLALVSVLVLGVTGYAWAAMQGLVNGLTMTDVIADDGGGALPADGARDILLVGMDSRTDAQGNPLPEKVLAELHAGEDDGELNTDTLIFVHIPNDGSKAVAISLPRDSYVEIPGYGKHKINSAYARAKLDERQRLMNQGVTDPKELELRSNQAGAKTLIATVEHLTGSTIDNYAAINLLGFYEITNAVGGVDVCLKNPVDDSKYSGAQFPAGPQTIAGADALAFVRQRHGLLRGDLDRVVRQQVFMAGLARKILSAGTLADPAKLSGLTEAIKKSVVLNQGWDILAFAEQMRNFTGGQIEFRTIPVENIDYMTPEDGKAVKVDPQEVRRFVQGLDGTPPPAQQRAPQESSVDVSTVTVDVYNASGETGLAAGVSGDLADQGFIAGETGNASFRQDSVVRVPVGDAAVGERVVAAIGGGATVEEDPSIAEGHVSVLLGTGYSTPDEQANATGPSAAEPQTGAQAQQQPPAPGEDEAPITADGVTCVN